MYECVHVCTVQLELSFNYYEMVRTKYCLSVVEAVSRLIPSFIYFQRIYTIFLISSILYTVFFVFCLYFLFFSSSQFKSYTLGLFLFHFRSFILSLSFALPIRSVIRRSFIRPFVRYSFTLFPFLSLSSFHLVIYNSAFNAGKVGNRGNIRNDNRQNVTGNHLPNLSDIIRISSV